MENIIEFPKLGLEFIINTTAFSIGGFEIKWYGIIIAVGFLLAFLYVSKNAKKLNVDMDKLFDVIVVGLIGAIVCARLYYVIFYPGDKFIKNPMEIFNIRDGGIGIYGGIIGAFLVGFIMLKIKKMNALAVFDLISIAFLIGQCIGRWGNFVNQEAFGGATDAVWGMHSAVTESLVPGANVHPSFLYESILCARGFVLLHIFTMKYRRYDGQTFLLYIAWYGAVRFFVEGTRIHSLLIPSVNLKVSQVLALLTVIIALIFLFAFRRRTSLTGCGNKKIMEACGLLQNNVVEDKTETEVLEQEQEKTEDIIETACEKIEKDLEEKDKT